MVWIPLNVHSQFSILDSTASVTALAEKAKANIMPAGAHMVADEDRLQNEDASRQKLHHKHS